MTVTDMWLPPSTRVAVTGTGLEPSGSFLISKANGDNNSNNNNNKPNFPVANDDFDDDLKAALLVCSLCNASNLVPPTPEVPEWTGVGAPTELALAVRSSSSSSSSSSSGYGGKIF